MIVKPKGAQKDVLALEPRGHTVVLGTAGSGKTTMALALAEKLSNLAGKPKVLVVTFSRSLVTYMQAIQSSQRGITVETFHKFALGYLRSRGERTNRCIIPEREKEEIIKQLVRKAHLHTKESTYARPAQTFIDEIQFLERFGVSSLEQYIQMERIGRADAYISRENRRFFYEIYEQYREIRSAREYLFDWDDIACEVYSQLQSDETERRYSHIIVDEGQDFSPMMLKALVCAVSPKGSFTFFGDVAQQIYGNAMSWRMSGINTKKVWRFERNYRNPREIALFAQDVLAHPKWEAKGEDYVLPDLAIPAAGVKPALVKCGDREEEQTLVVNLLADMHGKNVIILKNRALTSRMLNLLKDNGLQATEIIKDKSGSNSDGIYVTTFHSSKGLEFDNVFIPFLNEEDFPDQKSLSSSESQDKVFSDSLKLFYVAVTRAKQGLIMTYSETLTPLFPKNSQNYELNEY